MLLSAGAVLLFVLGVNGVPSADPRLGSLFVFAVLSAVIGACVLSCVETLNYAEREMVFVLDDEGIVRKRKGFPDVKIIFQEVDALAEQRRWLVIRSSQPRRKIAIPNCVSGYDVIRTELAKHHPFAAPAKFPLRNVVLVTVSVLSWIAVLCFANARIVISAGAIALLTLAEASKRLWALAHTGMNRVLVRVCLGFVWFSAIIVLYLRIVRS